MNFDSILIANRGEIACRVMQTAQNMGIKCIAVYVDADSDAPFVKMADEAVRLSSTYMDGDAIISAAKQTGAQAVHPGYGFLSENAAFARKVRNNKLVWIGPSPHVIKVMGDKLKAKELAEKSGVPTLPMTTDTKDAKKLGYPLLIKAAAGGGGSIGNFTFASSNIDTDDSSGITLTPAITFESDVTVQNDLVVNNTIRANKFVSTAVGSPKIISATNIELNAGGTVIVGKSALRLYSVTTTQRNALTASTGDIVYNSTLLKYQVRIGSAWKSLTIADDVPTNNNQLTNGAGYLTSAAEHTFTMTANGSSAYRFAQDTRYFPLASEDDPVLYVRRGETYNFINNSGGSHPFQIRTSNGGSAYNTGVTNNGAASGTISWTVPMTAPSTVYYQCTAHSGMGNTINIVT